MGIEVLDPTNEAVPPIGQLAPRPTTLVGKTVGIISNGKEGTKGFFKHLEQILRTDFGVAQVVTRVKSHFSAPADAWIVGEITSWEAMISGIGD